MQKGILFKQCDNLTVMESLPDKEYMMIYLDVPYYTGAGDFIYEDGSNAVTMVWFSKMVVHSENRRCLKR